MSAAALAPYIGREGLLPLDGIRIVVVVIDARYRFGTMDLRVTPEAGDGSRWVEADRVTLAP